MGFSAKQTTIGMKKITCMLCIVLFWACDEQKVVLPSSSGNINELSVVIENNLWQGKVGETIREHFARNVRGLPQQEPLFTLSQIPPEVFTGFVRKSRVFLKIEQADPTGITVLIDSLARPQTGVVVSAPTEEKIIQLIEQNQRQIISKFKQQELEEKRRRINKSLGNDKPLEEKLGVSLKFPSAYRYAKSTDDFFWLRKDLANGNMEILIYEVPMRVIDKGEDVIGNIIKMRDSIGKKYIPGPVEGSYMITEKAYAPYLFETKVGGKFAYLTKGTWEVENAFMAGPFINYAVRDEKNDRYVILEGFVFKPSARKRNNMFELKAILQTAEISSNPSTGKGELK